METKIVVYYGGVNYWNDPYFEELIFDTEEDADKFIQDLLNDKSKQVWKIVKTAQTIYYPEAERK